MGVAKWVKGRKRKFSKTRALTYKIMGKKKLIMIVEKTDTGFSAYALDSPIFTTGQSATEIINSAYEATAFHFEGEDEKVGPNDVRFEIDFKQFFKYYKVINAKFLAEKIGMNATLLSQYVSGTPPLKETNRKKS